MQTELILGITTFFTSGLTASVGVGGGQVLIAILPFLLPSSAIIPIHGLNQLASNLSRASASYKDIRFRVAPKFLIGSLLGVVLMTILIKIISLTYIPLFIGSYMLLSLHSPTFNKAIRKFESYFIIGFLQSGLSLVVGSTGPLSMPLLIKEFKDKDQIVSTQAMLMTTTHIYKVITFIFLGFSFSEYLGIIIYMMIGSVAGSYAGTHLRKKMDSAKFHKILKILLTILAIKMILKIFM